MRSFAILLRFIVFMCLVFVGTVLLDLQSKVGNPHLYLEVMIPCFVIMALFANAGVFKVTAEWVEIAERNEPYDPEPYRPTDYERRRALNPEYGEHERIPEHGN